MNGRTHSHVFDYQPPAPNAVNSTIDRTRFTEDAEGVPALRLKFVYSHTARLIIADSEDPTPDYTSEEREKHGPSHPLRLSY